MAHRNFRRLLTGCGLLAAGFFAAPHATYAHISICRSDPIIWLSNLTKVQMNAQIGTATNSVEAVHYDVHLPAGVTIRRVVYTQGPMKHLESFTPYWDSSSNTYTVDTTVSSPQSASVTATEQVVDWVSSKKASVQGTTNQVLSTTVNG